MGSKYNFTIQKLTHNFFLILFSTILLSSGCATMRHEPRAATYDVLVRVGWVSGGNLEWGENISVYKNRYCRINPGGNHSKWFRLSEEEYLRIESLLKQNDFAIFYNDSRSKVLKAPERERLYISYENDPKNPNLFDHTPVIIIEDKSIVPPSILALLKELGINPLNRTS